MNLINENAIGLFTKEKREKNNKTKQKLTRRRGYYK